MDLGIAGVSGITVICYLAAQGIKATPLNNKWLPVICGILGMLIMPDFPASDYITAVAIGIVSGLAATGANQVYKQLSSKEDSEE